MGFIFNNFIIQVLAKNLLPLLKLPIIPLRYLLQLPFIFTLVIYLCLLSILEPASVNIFLLVVKFLNKNIISTIYFYFI
jgi:hypothetical protein